MDGEMRVYPLKVWGWDREKDRDYTLQSPKAEYLYWSNRRERGDD